jgi:RND family efflux transporter MFP subunit
MDTNAPDVRPVDGAAQRAAADATNTSAPEAPAHSESVDASKLPKIRWWAVLLALVVGAAAFIKLYSLGSGPRRERADEAKTAAATYDPRPVVDVVKVRRGETASDLRLPADVDSMQQTLVFARTNGYLKSFSADVGDRVAAGRVLAEIDTPEIDAQIAWAHAAVDVARANVVKARVDLELADATLKRFEAFAATGGATAQQLDEKRSAAAQAKSALASAEANVVLADAEVKRLETLQGFEHVTAPFAGVVTARNYDVGALVGPSGASAAKELFRLESGDVLRAWVNVPQSYVASTKVGAKAFLTVSNWPGREFPGTLTRTAGVLDANTRTLRCEIDVPNPDGALFSGMYGEVRFPVTTDHPTLTVPTSAPTFGASGPTVWTVVDGHVHAKKVVLGRDFGAEIEVLDGLSPDDDVVKNPGERLLDGLEVRVAAKVTADARPGDDKRGEPKK